jgi:hypothetical protein
VLGQRRSDGLLRHSKLSGDNRGLHPSFDRGLDGVDPGRRQSRQPVFARFEFPRCRRGHALNGFAIARDRRWWGATRLFLRHCRRQIHEFTIGEPRKRLRQVSWKKGRAIQPGFSRPTFGSHGTGTVSTDGARHRAQYGPFDAGGASPPLPNGQQVMRARPGLGRPVPSLVGGLNDGKDLSGIERAKASGVYRGGKRRLDRDRVLELLQAGIKPSAVAG